MTYVAIFFGGPESVDVGWLEGMDVVEHDDPIHPIGVLLDEHAGHAITLTLLAPRKFRTNLAVWGLALS